MNTHFSLTRSLSATVAAPLYVSPLFPPLFSLPPSPFVLPIVEVEEPHRPRPPLCLRLTHTVPLTKHTTNLYTDEEEREEEGEDKGKEEGVDEKEKEEGCQRVALNSVYTKIQHPTTINHLINPLTTESASPLECMYGICVGMS